LKSKEGSKAQSGFATGLRHGLGLEPKFSLLSTFLAFANTELNCRRRQVFIGVDSPDDPILEVCLLRHVEDDSILKVCQLRHVEDDPVSFHSNCII
jgi:hypothetical protein